MKVLHVLSSLNIGSGIANFIMCYYREIISEDVRFDFLAFSPVEKSFEKEVENFGGKVYYIEKPTLYYKTYERKIKQFFKEHKGEWEIVHIHEILVQKFIAKYCKKLGGVKRIAIHSHAAQFVLPEYSVSKLKNKLVIMFKSIRNRFLLSGFKNNCDYYFACSEEAGNALYGNKILNSERFYIIKNAIDFNKYSFDKIIRDKYREEFNLHGKKVIIQIGRFCEQKNQAFLLDVLQKLCEKDNSYILMLVGDGPIRKELENKISKLGLTNNVVFTGNRTDVQNLLQCADLSVLPSTVEGLGIVLIEAQASGLPCLASSGVPREAKVTPYISFINLNVELWVATILQTELKRYSVKEFFDKSRYNITESSKQLKDIYTVMLTK